MAAVDPVLRKRLIHVGLVMPFLLRVERVVGIHKKIRFKLITADAIDVDVGLCGARVGNFKVMKLSKKLSNVQECCVNLSLLIVQEPFQKRLVRNTHSHLPVVHDLTEELVPDNNDGLKLPATVSLDFMKEGSSLLER